MAKYISVDDLLKEIENLVDKGKYKDVYDRFFRDGINSALYTLKGRINTLEAKEVDLNEELESFIENSKAWVKDNREVEYNNGDSFNHIYDLEKIAKHFFELGLKAQNRDNE